jgi:hypothetical protein
VEVGLPVSFDSGVNRKQGLSGIIIQCFAVVVIPISVK